MIEELLEAMFSLGSARRLYNEDPRPVDLVEGWQFSRALQGRLRRDGAIVELTVEKNSARATVTR
jgi:hypothetical protein